MRLWMTGGTGFVGSNIVHAATAAGVDVMTTVHTFRPPAETGYRVDRVDMTDAAQTKRSIIAFDPDIVVHCAILNDWDLMYADRKGSWAAYVTATETTAEAAAEAGAAYVLISTDWVFDGSQAGADESTPPNPVNLYGVLKLASEIVALDRGGAVARVSGVNGLHRIRPAMPRKQDAGFGYLVASMVDAVSRGEVFELWESAAINMIATPSLATECGELVLEIGSRRLDGVFHLCGADSVGRQALIRHACEVFDLDFGLVTPAEAPASANAGAAIPYDTSLVAPRTSELLGRRPTPLRTLLERFREEYEALTA